MNGRRAKAEFESETLALHCKSEMCNVCGLKEQVYVLLLRVVFRVSGFEHLVLGFVAYLQF